MYKTVFLKFQYLYLHPIPNNHYATYPTNYHYKHYFLPNQWLYVISCLILLTSISSTIGRIWKNRITYLIANFSSFIILLGIISLFIFVDVYYNLSNNESGVIIAKEGRVYSAPSHSSNLLFVVHEGTKADISNRQNPWVEIQLIDGKKGWLSVKHMSCLLYTSPSPRDGLLSRMPSSA